jgi:hypothetical protein
VIPQKWTNRQLVQVLTSIPVEPNAARAWWSSLAGYALLEEMEHHMTAPIVAAARRELSVEVDASEVASTAWLLLSPERSLLLKHLVSPDTENPWGYLHASVKNQVLDDVGRYFRRELTDALEDRAVEEPADEERTLEFVVARTACVLAPVTPRPLRRGLRDAVDWMADAATRGRLSHLHSLAGRSAELRELGFGGDRARALANVTVGKRPDHSVSSLFAGFLLQPQWEPTHSPRHAASIREYAVRIAAVSGRSAA